MKPFIPLMACFLLLTACAQTFKADVTRFHRLEAPRGDSVFVLPEPEQEGGIAFQAHADRVLARLAEHGFVAAATEQEADYVVKLGYSVTAAREVVGDSSPVSIGVGVGGGSRSTRVGVGASFGLGGGDDGRLYFLRLSLTMTERKSGERVFEGLVNSESRSRDIDAALPYMIDALFQTFPGESGETETVKLEMNDGNR